jgi:hypothetical protein
MTIAWTGSLEHDWRLLRRLWEQSPHVLQSEVGPLWEMPPQHQACIEFARHYPEGRDFLIAQLTDPDPRIAAYAFKCLARVTEICRSDIPGSVFARSEKITTLMHSFIDETTVGQFVDHYFEAYGSQEDLLEEQERSIDWQENDLKEFKRQAGYKSNEGAG